MRVLVIAGDYYHPAGVIEEGLRLLEGAEFTFTMTETERDFSVFDVVMLCKSDRVSAENAQDFMKGDFTGRLIRFVENGGGLLAAHAGTTAAKNNPELKALIGCCFDHHPAQCPVRYQPAGEKSLTEGVVGFEEMDEHYFLQMSVDDADVFLTSQSENGTQPAGYTRRVQKGRVAVLTPGHNVPVWIHPQMQTLLRRTLEWCAGGRV